MKALLLKYNCPPTEIDINNINRVIPNNYVVDVYIMECRSAKHCTS